MDAAKIVRDFCAAIPRRDVTELASFFAEDAVYHNIPLAPVTGRTAIAETLSGFLGPASEAAFEMRALAVAGRTVLTERVDRFVINGKRIELPVMGAFDVGPDGAIAAWRDYFDMQMFTSQLG